MTNPTKALADLFDGVGLPWDEVQKNKDGRLEPPAPASTEEDPVAGAPVPINQNGVKPGPQKLAQFIKAMELVNMPTRSQGADDPVVHIKLFNPQGEATWLLTDWQPEDKTAFGWCHLLGRDCAELGYVSLEELAYSPGGRLGIGIEIDNWFTPKLLSQAKAELYGDEE
jgi:hypothetical protein